MKSTLVILLATVALARMLGPPTLDAIQGTSNTNAGGSAIGADTPESSAVPAVREAAQHTKRKRDDDWSTASQFDGINTLNLHARGKLIRRAQAESFNSA